MLPLVYYGVPLPAATDEHQREYRLVIKTPTGERISDLVGTSDGFLSIAASMHVNDTGVLTFEMLADNPVIPLLEYDSQIELWYNQSLLFTTLYQDPQFDLLEEGYEKFTATCIGEKDLLARAVVAWEPDTLNRSLFGEMKAESLMHILVEFNVTAAATVANGRLLDFKDIHVTVEADLGRGLMMPAQQDLSGKNLLDALKEIASIGNIDFDLVKTNDDQWIFRVYDTQRGIDRRDTVVFSRSRNNMKTASLIQQRNQAKTVIVAGGTGEGKARETAIRYGPDYDVDYHREYFHADTGSSGALLQSSGDKAAQDQRMKTVLTFDPAQVDGFRFGSEYNMGDLVRAEYRGIVTDYEIAGVSLAYGSDGNETVSIELEEFIEVEE